jgi:protein-S-isoprenylcysteine O-methyltransferase Ste14
MNFYKIFLPVFSLVYLLQIFVIHSYLLWKKTGVNPIVFGKTESAHDYIGRIYKLMTVVTWVAIGSYSFYPKTYDYLMPIWYLELESLKVVGACLLLLSFGWIVIAQRQMATSWRIGINYEEQTRLVDTGLFGVSRNPVFLGIFVSNLGTFLIIPNALTAVVWIVTFVSIQVQVRMEEEFMRESIGYEYEEYRKRVRRWV